MQLIDLTGLTTFGNMTGGDGLAGIMNLSNATVGYSQAITGYAGVTLSSPTAIVAADIISADNGFDASGNTTSITLTLYGKTGSAPSNSTDGTNLGSLTFTDVNANTTKTINSTNSITEYDHVWVTVETGVWCILAAFKPYGHDAQYWPATPTDLGSKWTIKHSINKIIELTPQEAEIPDSRVAVFTEDAATATLSFYCSARHEYKNDYDGVLEVSMPLWVRVGDTYALAKASSRQFIENASDGGNILNHTHHYINLKAQAKVALEANKYYIFGVDMLARATGEDTVVGQAVILAEGEAPNTKGNNSFIVTVDKNETLVVV